MEPLCIPFSLSSSDLFLIANKFLCVPCKNPEILKIKCQFSFSSSSLPQAKETNKTNSSFVFLFLHQTVELPSTQVLSTCAPTGASRSFPKLFLWPLPTCPSLYQVRPSSLTFQFRCHSSWECSWNPTTKVVFLPVCPHDVVLSLSQQLP